ncbi:MAG: hypothetical protein R6W75_06875 [Smithellaceae bacterium]
MDIIVQYCGGCNCQIDRSKILEQVASSLPEGFRLTTDTAGSPFEIGILLCGCTSACAWRLELTGLARRWIVVAGKSVNAREMPENQLAAAIVAKINQEK